MSDVEEEVIDEVEENVEVETKEDVPSGGPIEEEETTEGTKNDVEVEEERSTTNGSSSSSRAGMHPDVESAFRRAFDSFDRDRDGSINVKDMCTSMNALTVDGEKITVTKSEIREMIQEFGSETTISYDSFLDFFFKKLEEMDSSKMVDIAFDSFDLDKDNNIGPEDLGKAFAELGNRASAWEIKELIQSADTNNDGTLSQDEFTAWMNRAG